MFSAATKIVAELERLGLLVSKDGATVLDPRVIDLARAEIAPAADPLVGAEAALAEGRTEEALFAFRSAARSAMETGDGTLAARALTGAASALRRVGRTGAAIESLTQALAQLEEGASLERGNALALLGLARRDAGDVAAALEAHTQAEYVFGALGDVKAQARERTVLGSLHLDHGRLGEAQRAFVEVLGAPGAGADLGATLVAQAGIVQIRARRGDASEALDTLSAGLATAREEGLREAEIACLTGITIVHGLLGDAAKSDDAYAAATALMRSRGAHRATATLHAAVAERRAARGDATRAQEALRAAEAVAGAAGDGHVIAQVALARASILETTGDLTGALAAYWEAADAARRAGASSIENAACVLSGQLDPDRARAAGYIRKSLLALAAECDRAAFTLRPALAIWLGERVDSFDVPQQDRAAVVDLLTVAAPVDDVPAPRAGGLQVSLLGALDVRIGGQRISDRAWRTSKAKELFSLLLVHRERTMGRDEIIELLWPDAEPASGISNFHFTLHALRKALASTKAANAPTVRTEGGYQLLTNDRSPIDIDVFALLLHEANRFRRAGRSDDAVRLFRAGTALYRADLLTDLDAEWVAERREDVVRQYLSGLRQLAELELERDEAGATVAACRKYLEREPYDEHVHRLLMRAYRAQGDGALVERHYRTLTDLLRRELGTQPERETTQLYEKLRGKDGRIGQLSPVQVKAR
jgi:DNA-binding SARP family transcriptional activator